MTPLCLILSDDLLDASRIMGEGRAAGVLVVQCRDSTALLKARERKPVLLMVDLHNPGLDVVALATAAEGIKIVGFGSHVDVVRLKAARRAGCDEVLPRSEFFADLGSKLTHWTSGGTSG